MVNNRFQGKSKTNYLVSVIGLLYILKQISRLDYTYYSNWTPPNMLVIYKIIFKLFF